MHHLDEKILVTPALLRRFSAEAEHSAGNGSYYAILIGSDGGFIEHQIGPGLAPEQTIFGRDMVFLLNRHLHHDGAWMIVFTNPTPKPIIEIHGTVYQRFVFLWMDKDGDVRFPIENEEPFHEVLKAGPIAWLQQAEVAWTTWHRLTHQVLDVRPSETYKRAQGESAPSTVH